MKKLLFICFAALFVHCNDAPPVKSNLRAPAYPLVTIDPYTSAWSVTDNLYDDDVKHWTGKSFPLLGVLRVDGKPYRFMGVEKTPLRTVAAISYEAPWSGKYTFDKPAQKWESVDFDDSKWTSGEASFGTPEEKNVKTLWQTNDIWVRRDIKTEPLNPNKKLFLKYSHDDAFELYINGLSVVNTGDEYRKDVFIQLPDEIKATAADGHITVAAHCFNKTGGGLVDFGIYAEAEVVKQFDNPAIQQSVDVQATQTHYVFKCGNVELKLSFLSPLLLDDLNLISRPVNYISYNVTSLDGNEHQTEIYFEAAPEWAINESGQVSKAEGYEKDNLLFLKTGNVEQKILGRRGDNVRIDWGYFYLSSEKGNASAAVGEAFGLRGQFAGKGSLSGDVTAKDNANLAIAQSLGKSKTAAGKVLIGYDDVYSIKYFDTNLRPYWNKDGNKSIESAFADADKEFASLKTKCTGFDNSLIAKATKAGGKEYAELCALAYRQSIAAHKLVEAPDGGDLLFLSKENFSNGSIGTVDVTYPSAPLFLLYNPELAKGLLNHIFYYSESGKWKKPFPAHDVGTYPWANGQTYGGDMPVEEAGNMLTLTAAIAKVEGNANYSGKHWETLTVWTDYLAEKGLDPENQLCTDDFAGHFAHNVNLSVKAIMGIASYAYLAEKLGKHDVAEKYTAKAKAMAQQWLKMADDGDHYRLTFDQSGTWSQKYNLVWDKLLQLNIFPKTVIEKEIPYYLTKQNTYGLPLDNRRNYTKADWIIWTATLADDTETFGKFIRPLYKFVNETTDRIPMSDWYNTDNTKHVGFQARSVVGGYYIKLLEEKLRY